MAAALFIDLDGTCLRFHTNEWLPGVREKLCSLAARGHQIHFITMRGEHDDLQIWSIEATKKLLAELPFQYKVIFGVYSPRMLIDDGGCGHLQVSTNEPNWILTL